MISKLYPKLIFAVPIAPELSIPIKNATTVTATASAAFVQLAAVRGRLNESIFGIFFTKYFISTRPSLFFRLTLQHERSVYSVGIPQVKQKTEKIPFQ
jgi:hypothetical protein